MKNKIFGLLTIVLFMSSTTNIYAMQLSDCEILVNNIHTMLKDHGVDHGTAYLISGEALEACEDAN